MTSLDARTKRKHCKSLSLKNMFLIESLYADDFVHLNKQLDHDMLQIFLVSKLLLNSIFF